MILLHGKKNFFFHFLLSIFFFIFSVSKTTLHTLHTLHLYNINTKIFN